jgi:hypothetical protein
VAAPREGVRSDGRLVKMIEVYNRKVQERTTLKGARNVDRRSIDCSGQRPDGF